MTDQKLSIVLTTHAEGRVLVPTIRSLRRAFEAALDAGIATELVVVMDRIDEETDRVLQAHVLNGDFPGEMLPVTVDNGDLGASRNDGILASSGAVVGVFDGDNLVTREWLVDSFRVVNESGGNVIAHPELVVAFGARRTLWPLLASDDPRFKSELFAAVNYWDACVIAPRAVFESVPYLVLPPGDGYGPEDWAWNLDTLEKGFRHVIVPQSALFYRAREDSLLSEHSGSLLPRVPFLTSLHRARSVVERFGGLPTRQERSGFRETLRRRVPRGVRHPVSLALRSFRSVLRPWLHGGRRVVERFHQQPVPVARVPEWLEAEWRAANRLEPEVPFLRPGVIEAYEKWGDPFGEAEEERSVAYWRIVDALGGPVDYLFLAPWVRTGGGDLVLLQHIEAVRRLHPSARVGLLTTEPEASTRLDHVPDGVVVVELRKYESRWVDREWLVAHLLPQLLTQQPPLTMHVFNSTVGFDVVERFGRLLSLRTALFLSTFVLDRTPDGEATSVLFYRHSRFLTPVQAVLVDSRTFAEEISSQWGYPLSKFLVQRQVVRALAPRVDREGREFSADRPLRILWAGRFDLQKRLDVLADVAESATRLGLPVQFDFYGEVVMGDPTVDESLSRLESTGARRHPPYTDIAQIPLDDFDVFLMTSEWEGVPNTMLEVMSAGIPVVAPSVGGIPEVLNEETGFPIARFDDTDAYLDAFRSLVAEYDVAARRAARAHETILTQFSDEAFDESLRAIPAYLGGHRAAELQELEFEFEFEFVATEDTAEFLRSSAARVYLFSGSQGYANLGDILQAKNIVRLWRDFSPSVEPVLFFDARSAVDMDHVAQLQSWYGCRHIVFARAAEDEDADFLKPPGDIVTTAHVHVIGGGYLNLMWGDRYLRIIEAISELLPVDEYLFSGMQFDEFILPRLTQFARQHRVVAVGTRDSSSDEIARVAFGSLAQPSFDDLYEVYREWTSAPARLADAPRPFRLGLHINASGYAGGTMVIDAMRSAIAAVRAAHDEVEFVLLNAYDDARPEVLDTLASLRLFGDDLPFDRFEAVDLVRVALDAELPGMAPKLVTELRLDAAVTCSYHTTLLLHMLGIPAFLLRLNEYYAQKAAIFELPDDFSVFLADPRAFLRDFPEERATRERWMSHLRVWMAGGEFTSPPEPST